MRLPRITATLASLAAAVALAAAPALATPAGASPLPIPIPGQSEVPLPEDDPFYRVPPKIKGLANGSILRSRPIDASTWNVPMPATAWQILYKTLDNHHRPTATVATVLVPDAPWTGDGPRPLLSYQTAEDGIDTKCAPSYALRAGAAAGDTNSNLETPIVFTALTQGWTLVVPDYEGPRSLFLAARMAAHGLLDGIRAARAFKPAGVGKRAPIGLWGYSGGSLATSVAAQLQPRYAPELKFAGIALGGLVADIRSTIDAFDGSPLGGAIMMGIEGMDRAFPEADIRSLITREGREKMDASAKDCINDAVRRHGLLFSYRPYEAVPNSLDVPRIKRLQKRNSPLTFGGIPRTPVFHYHATLDEYAPIAPAARLMAKWCAAGVTVQRQEEPVGEHITGVITGVPHGLLYLSDRFAGKPAPSTCAD